MGKIAGLAVADPERRQSWLFFGSQHQALDFLYRDELLDWVDDGTIARLDAAWSRDQEHKVYVQDKLYESGPNIWRWLDAGAYVYICGDASRMAKDVNAMLIRIVEEFGGLSKSEAQANADRTSEGTRKFMERQHGGGGGAGGSLSGLEQY